MKPAPHQTEAVAQVLLAHPLAPCLGELDPVAARHLADAAWNVIEPIMHERILAFVRTLVAAEEPKSKAIGIIDILLKHPGAVP